MQKKLLGLLLTPSLILMACAGQDPHPTSSYDENHKNMQQASMANPFADFDTLDAAAARAGFAMPMPRVLPEGYVPTNYRTMVNGQKLIEVICKNGDKELCFRKGIADNISGMYTEFPETSTHDISGTKVTFKGSKGLVQVAQWNIGAFSYSINANTYNTHDYTVSGGLAKHEMLALITDMLGK